MTLIAVYTSSGCVGRCDAKCYLALEPNCTCACGGANHGAGLRQALRNAEERWKDWIKAAKQENPDLCGYALSTELEQPLLPFDPSAQLLEPTRRRKGVARDA